MNKNVNISPVKYLKSSQKSDLMVMVCDRMVRVLAIDLETVSLDPIDGLGSEVIKLILYPVDEDGKVRLGAGIVVTASVIERSAETVRLAFKTSTYPLSKMIIRCLASRQGIEPYHSKIGL